MRALWLPDILTDAGFDVHVEPGWETRGSANWGPIKAIVCHHTAWPLNSQDYPSLRLVRDGRLPPDPSPVPGPLSQLGLGRSGKVYVLASGRANHAGVGSTPKGVVTFAGSSESIGIEAEHPGGSHTWTPVQYDAYVRLCVALADHLNLKTTQVLGHKEWAPGRKPDPNFPMALFRGDIERTRKEDEMAQFTEAEVQTLRELVNSINSVGSSGYFAEQIIRDIRKNVITKDELDTALAKLGGTGGGITQEQADARYVRSGQPVRIN